MKVVILAAGKGIRLLPVTENIPKVLVEVAGKPFLYYLIKILEKAGYTEFGMVVSYKKEKIVDFLNEFNIKATLIHQGEPLGTGHAVLQAKDFVGNDNFVCINGDDLHPVEDFQAMANQDDLHYVLATEVNDPENYGVLVEKEGKLEKVIEKPKEFISNLINSGIYKFTPEIFDELEKIEKSERGEYELTDAISSLAKQGKVKIIHAKGFFASLSRPEDIPHIESILKELNLS